MEYIDAHCHLYGFSDNEIIDIFSNMKITIVAVSEDYKSSKKVVTLGGRIENVVPCIGLHPWNVDKNFENEIEQILSLRKHVKCFGEIGLDKRFNKDNYEYQLKAFEIFLDEASRNNFVLNLHALDAWLEVLQLLKKYDIKKAIFHWYSGPLNVLKAIEESNYYITINPSVDFQKKHMRVLEEVSLSNILTESDGPYNYRGRILHPNMIPKTIEIISKTKNVNIEEVLSIILKSFKKVFG